MKEIVLIILFDRNNWKYNFLKLVNITIPWTRAASLQHTLLQAVHGCGL